jgi:hypothetical protein
MNANLFGLGNANFGTADPLTAAKFYPPRNFEVSREGTLANGTTKHYFGPMRTGGVLQKLDAIITETILTGDRTVTITLKKSTGGAAFASVLSATFQFLNGDTLLVKKSASFSDTTFVAGDVFELSIVTAGSSGTQPAGVAVHLSAYEHPST